MLLINPLSANPTKWSNKFKQFVGKLPTNCLSVFDHFVGLALKGLNYQSNQPKTNFMCCKKHIAKTLFRIAKPPVFAPVAGSNSFRSCCKTVIHFFFVNSNPELQEIEQLILCLDTLLLCLSSDLYKSDI